VILLQLLAGLLSTKVPTQLNKKHDEIAGIAESLELMGCANAAPAHVSFGGNQSAALSYQGKMPLSAMPAICYQLSALSYASYFIMLFIQLSWNLC
jgi:hypothetical protein